MSTHRKLSKHLIAIGTSLCMVAPASYGAMCKYQIDSEQGGEFNAKIVIKNNSDETIKNWQVNWEYMGNNVVTSGSGAEFSFNSPYSASYLSTNKRINPGESVKIKITGKKGGEDAEIPTLSGSICDEVPVPVATPTPAPTKSPTPTTTPNPDTSFYSLPNDWPVVAIEDQNCNVNDLGKVDNTYIQTASKLFAWITGTLDQAYFEPIGEISNYFGFAALRNEIRDRSNDANADEQFRGTIYKEILELLDDSQRAILYDLLAAQRKPIADFLANRLDFIDELWTLKNNNTLDFERLDELMTKLGKDEGDITALSAQYYAKLFETITPEQGQYLADIRSGAITAADMEKSTLAYAKEANAQYKALSDTDAEIMVEVASKVISWYTGDLQASIFLPNGKIGNYFGFAHYRYVDRAGVSRSGAADFIDQVITPEQQAVLCGVSTNVMDYTNDYIDGRAELITRLDPVKTNMDLSVDGFAQDYAELAGTGEGRRAVIEALTFHLIESMMSPAQIQELKSLRK